ncbi:MAG: hypothetical protein IJR21_09695 [Synergistaceae bacterium]|nr:hypothetical protein [Synergistaceae bacterium]
MRKFIAALSLLCLFSGAAYALKADDFLPPVQAESKAGQEELLKDKSPEDKLELVKDEKLGLEVAEFKSQSVSLQDAINKVITKPKTGCQVVRGDNQGPTLVATGMGTYSLNYENIMASRIEQRNAYVIAFMRAKDEMARTLSGISFEGASYFEQGSQSQTNSLKVLNNINTSLSERLKQWAQAVLKGYVTYSVQDDGKGRVYVTIVSSPKTRANFDRNGYSSEGLTAETLREGLDSIIAEIKKGLVPPVGGRIVEANTGEVAWVGFGSAIVRLDSEPDVQAELELQAEQIAGLRAVDGLAGIIFGDETKWQAHVDEDTSRMIKSFEAAQKNDPVIKGAKGGLNAGIKEYENRVREMRNEIINNEKVSSIRSGILPPGIMRQTELDDDGYFAYGIAVYLPSASDMAAQAKQEMEKTEIVREVNPNAFKNTQGITPQKVDPNKTQEMKRGPSGVVEQNL